MSLEQSERLLSKVDRNGDHLVDLDEFCLLMCRAQHLHMLPVLLRAAQLVVPHNQRAQPFSYLQQYNCMPPPLFMPLISIVQVSIYIYYVILYDSGVSLHQPVPIKSPLIFSPYKREQIWRYLSYMFIHIGIFHLLVNVLTQLILGIPLELVHKWRTVVIYMIGVISGSILVSAVDPNVYLAGASGGVYALLAGHVAELIINWKEMEFAGIRAGVLFLLIAIDGGVSVYQRHFIDMTNRVSYASHLAGFVAGILMGIVILRNFRTRSWEKIVWWIALIIYILLFCLCIAFSIARNFIGQ